MDHEFISGPDHKRMSKLERQDALKTQYFFTCQCSACQKEDKQDVFNVSITCKKINKNKKNT